MGHPSSDGRVASFGAFGRWVAIDGDRLVRETFLRRVELHATLDSTNDRAKRLVLPQHASLGVSATDPSGAQPAEAAQTGTGIARGTPIPGRVEAPAIEPEECPTPLLIVAEHQTAGRGRGTHRWWSSPGALMFSLLLGPQHLPPRRTPLLSLGTAVAVAHSVAPLASPYEVGLHWPNDVMVDGRKLAGILLEISRSGHGVIGIGVNTNNRLVDDVPDEVRRRAVTLLDLTGRASDPTDLLVAIVRHLEQVLDDLRSDPTRVAAAADALCQQRGQSLRMLCAGRHLEGRCAGIGPDGALLLDTPEGRHAIHSGVGA